MKDALQSTADENGRLHERLAAEARKQDGLQAELAKSGWGLPFALAVMPTEGAASTKGTRMLRPL